MWGGASTLISLSGKPASVSVRAVNGQLGVAALQPPLFPGPEGRSIATGSGSIVDQYGKIIAASDPTRQGVFLVPTTDSAYTLRVRASGRSGNSQYEVPALGVVLPGGAELLRVESADELNDSSGWFNNAAGGMSADRRIILDPASQRLLTIPTQNDRVVSRKLDLDGAFERLADTPVVTSPMRVWATTGQEFRHQIKARSKKGGLTFELAGGNTPAALHITSEGVVTWNVPSKTEMSEVAIAVTIRDAAAQEATSVLKILVR
jgi:hypothetical protein